MTIDRAIVTILGALLAVICLVLGICFLAIKLIPSLFFHTHTMDDNE